MPVKCLLNWAYHVTVMPHVRVMRRVSPTDNVKVIPKGTRGRAGVGPLIVKLSQNVNNHAKSKKITQSVIYVSYATQNVKGW